MSMTISCTVESALSYAKADTMETIKRTRERGRELAKRIKSNARQLAALALVLPEGIKWDCFSPWQYSHPSIMVARDRLAELRKAIGRLHKESAMLESAEERTVRVTLSSERFPGIQFCYIRPLVEGSKCRIKQETSTYYSLSCEL